MRSLATARRFARASQGRCAHAARRRESRRAAWRCKLRVGTADCIAGRCKGCIRAAEQRFCNRFQQRAVWTTQWCCTRARGGRGLRDAELHRLTNERLGCQQVDALGTGSKSLVFGGIHPKQNGYWSRRRHTSNRTRGTRSSQRLEQSALQHSPSGPTNARYAVGPRLHNTKRTKPLLPWSRRHNNSAGAAVHSAQKEATSHAAAAAPINTKR